MMASQKSHHHHHKHVRHHHHSHPQHQQEPHSSDGQDSNGTQSTEEESAALHHSHGHNNHHQHHSGESHRPPLDHHHDHHHHHQLHFHTPDVTSPSQAAAASSGSSSSSSSSSFSSSTSSASSCSSSGSSSSWSSDFSIDRTRPEDDRLRRPQHSLSCTDISKGRTFDEEDDDTIPLLDDKDQLFIDSTEGEAKTTSLSYQPAKGILKKQLLVTEDVTMAGNVRKAKSMEALPRHDGREANEEKLERRKENAKRNLVEEKLQFSAFLNEITRQVLSPSSLTSLGVTDLYRPTSPGQVSLRSTKVEHIVVERTRQRGSSPGSGDSMASSIQSNISKRSRSSKHSCSSKHSHAHLGKRHHHSHHQSAKGTPPHRHHSPGSITNASKSPLHSPSRHHHGGHHYRDHQTLTHPYHQGDHDSPTHYYGDHQSSTHHREDNQSPTTQQSFESHKELHHTPHASNTKSHHHDTTHPDSHHSTSTEALQQTSSLTDSEQSQHRHHFHHHEDHHHPAQGESHHSHHHEDHHHPAHGESHHSHHHEDHHHPAHGESHHSHHHPAHGESHHSHHHEDHHHPAHGESHHSHHHPAHGESHHSHHHEDYHSSSCQKRRSPVSMPSAGELESHSMKSDSSSTSPQDEQQRSSASSLNKEKASELDRITMLQAQNEDLHHDLLQTAARMESMGAEFQSSHQLLESELQRTYVELSGLQGKFERLQENYSSTQQTNDLLERKLHSVAQNMEGERERLNQCISALAEQLASAKTTIHNMETINVTSVLQEAIGKHLQSDNSINQFLLPVAPPPAQFMDVHAYGKVTQTGEGQRLGPVPEEEESDWSEMGEETPPRFILGGSRGSHQGTTAFSPWRHDHWEGQGEGDTESESGGEEVVIQNPPCSSQIPHVQFTVLSGTIPAPKTDKCPAGSASDSEGGYEVITTRRLGSPVRKLSASLEEIPMRWGQQHRLEEQHSQLRGTEAMLDLHHSEDGAMEDSDEDEIIQNWRTRSDRDLVMEGGLLDDREPLDPSNSLISLQSAQRMLNHFITQLKPSEEECQGGVEVRGWIGVPEEVLNGERTQL